MAADSSRQPSKIKYEVIWAALIGAVATLAATVLTLLVGSKTDVIQVQFGAPPAVAPTASAIPATSSAQPTASASTSTAIAPLAYHHDPARLVSGAWGLDFDAPPDDHSWTKPGGTGIELSYDLPDGLSLGAWTGGVVLMQGAPSFDACNHASGFSKDEVTISKLRRYQFMCIMTSDKRMSVAAVTSITDQEVDFDVTTYPKEGD